MRFCTKFDHRYLDRGLALYDSVRKHAPESEFDVLALSKECEQFLQKLNASHLNVISLDDMMTREVELYPLRDSRSATDFIFTLTPFLCAQSLGHARDGETVVYVDADSMLFGPPALLDEMCGSYEVAVTPHNFSNHHKHKAKAGLYNTGWTAFRHSTNGIKCVEWWREKCLEWCHDRVEKDRFADQKYIEHFSDVVSNVYAIPHPGFNCAPWNASYRRFSKKGAQVCVDGVPLVHFHFSHAKRLTKHILATRLAQQYVIKAQSLRRHVYSPYATALKNAQHLWNIPDHYLFDGARVRDYETHSKELSADYAPSFWRYCFKLISGDYVVGGLFH